MYTFYLVTILLILAIDITDKTAVLTEIQLIKLNTTQTKLIYPVTKLLT
jgi:hypothetical protein